VSFDDALDEDIDREPATHRIRREGLDSVPFRREDERFRHPEVIEKRERNVVVVNVRDVSGSMRETKRELVERVFTPMDWYLTGKYDAAEFRYVVHDDEEVGGRPRRVLRDPVGRAPGSPAPTSWSRRSSKSTPTASGTATCSAAGDSENAGSDTTESVMPLMESIDANLHAYVETQPGGAAPNARHADEVEEALGNTGNIAVARVSRAGRRHRRHLRDPQYRSRRRRRRDRRRGGKRADRRR